MNDKTLLRQSFVYLFIENFISYKQKSLAGAMCTKCVMKRFAFILARVLFSPYSLWLRCFCLFGGFNVEKAAALFLVKNLGGLCWFLRVVLLL